jgi:hypothetical protein
VATVRDAFFQRELHEFLGRRRHILEVLSEGYDRETYTFEVLNNLDGFPPVEGNLANVEAPAADVR